jgi:predicted MPP superfamily phosphohydrolase
LVSRYPIDIILLVIVAGVQLAGTRLLLGAAGSRGARRAIRWGAAASLLFLAASVAVWREPIRHLVPDSIIAWMRGTSAGWALMSSMLVAGLAVSRLFRVQAGHSPGRRAFLRTAQTACLAAPVAATGYGTFIQRSDFRLREQDLPFPNLPPDLDGLRLVQLTDIHRSAFLSDRELERVVAMANETRAHVALVTGDLISAAGDPLDECLERLSRLQSDAGIFGCLGNHEIYAGAEEHATQRGAALGLRFLRSQAAALRFGSATLNLAGVDYQRIGRPYLRGAETLLVPGAFNVLLSHNPDVFPVAAAQGFPLTVSGHTHGGQVNFEILGQDVTIARFLTPYVDGLYRKGDAAVFVSRGIGTIALPARLGAPPEVALLRLCHT